MIGGAMLGAEASTAVAFTIPSLGLTIRWYGIFIAVGIILSVILGCIEVKRQKLNKDTMYDVCLYAVPLGVIFARLYYVLFRLGEYMDNPIEILYIWKGGLAIYGAVIGGLLGIFIYSRVKKVRFLKIADLITPGLVLSQAIGRWGNFMNQEAYGPLVTNPSHMWFPLAVTLDSGEVHYATFFYESAWCFIIFIVLWFFLRKRKKHDGDLMLYYVLLYSFERMFVEGLREDSLWLVGNAETGGIRVSQLLSFILFAATLAFIIVRAVREKKIGHPVWPKPEAASSGDEQVCENNTDSDKPEEGGESETGDSAECEEHGDTCGTEHESAEGETK